MGIDIRTPICRECKYSGMNVVLYPVLEPDETVLWICPNCNVGHIAYKRTQTYPAPLWLVESREGELEE